VLALALLALSTPAPATPANAGFAGADLDPALVDEVTGFTAELIRAAGDKSTRDRRVIELLASRLEEAGIDVDVPPIGEQAASLPRFHLKAVLHGRDPKKPALLLLGHTAVAPANDEGWRTPPFEGAIERGRLVGRGASDVLALDALEALTLVALKRAGVSLERDVVLVVSNDVDAAFALWPPLKRHVAYALGGGGAFVESGLSPGADLVEVAAADKGLLRVHLTARGPVGTVSAPPLAAAADRVARAASRVVAAVEARPLRMTAPTARRLADVGVAKGGFEGMLLQNPALASAFARDELSPASLFRDTCALTELSAAGVDGALPESARASLECRLLPGTDPHDMIDDILRAADDPRVDLVVDRAVPAHHSDPDGALVAAIRARMTAELPGAAVVTTLSADVTDCYAVRANGLPCVGFAPVLVTSSERADAHGKNESVRTAELEKALSRVADIAASLAK
jgi:acetylornithine deacetylase/succinyl-diaminopimelate desuccinylase-like protein